MIQLSGVFTFYENKAYITSAQTVSVDKLLHLINLKKISKLPTYRPINLREKIPHSQYKPISVFAQVILQRCLERSCSEKHQKLAGKCYEPELLYTKCFTKKGSSGDYLGILQNALEQFFSRIPMNNCFFNIHFALCCLCLQQQ